MWKNETQEIRAKYYAKSLALKDQIMRLNPEYRYQPRKSSQIKRRVRVINDQSLEGRQNFTLLPSDDYMIRQLYPGITGIKTNEDDGSADIYRQKIGADHHLPPLNIPNWTPWAFPEQLIDMNSLTHTTQAPINQVAVFGKTVPMIDPEAGILSNILDDECDERVVDVNEKGQDNGDDEDAADADEDSQNNDDTDDNVTDLEAAPTNSTDDEIDALINSIVY